MACTSLGSGRESNSCHYATVPKRLNRHVRKSWHCGSGNFQLAWGSKGSGNGQFGSGGQNLAVDYANNVYVTDPVNYRIQKFDSSGNFKFAWGSQGSGNGEFATGSVDTTGYVSATPSPGGVAVDLADYVYVIDPGNYRVQKFYEIETTLPSFQPVQPNNMDIYVLGSDGNLWFETGPFGTQIPPPRLQVDGNVIAFQALDGNNVVVLGSDGNLWLETWPYGNVQQTINTRSQIDGNVAAFQVVISGFGNNAFVLGSDGNLWRETWPPSGNVNRTIATRQQIDGQVKAFQAMDVDDVIVLGADGDLWWEGTPFGSVAQTIQNRRQIDANVKAFQGIDYYNIFVLGTDRNLWLETWPLPAKATPGYSGWGNVPETIKNRQQVDGNVAAFQAIDVNTVFVLGTDGNLWLETSPWGNVSQTIQTRTHIATNVGAFYAWADAYHASGTSRIWTIFIKDTDHVLRYYISGLPYTTWTQIQVDGNVM